MRLPLSWLNEYVEIKGVDYRQLAERLVHIGFEIEDIIDLGAAFDGVYTGKILSISRHENADRLSVCAVSVGKQQLQIVTGAKNIAVGDIVPVALDGARLVGGLQIKSGAIRGTLSEGMFCGGSELGIDDNVIDGASVDGILILPKAVKTGIDIKAVLGLNEIIFDVSVTANRPDCQSIYGLAREVAVMLNRPLKPLNLKYKVKKIEGVKLPAVNVENSALCSRYTATVIKNVQVGASCDLIKRRLRYMGLKSISNVVDITNYVLCEVGQPLHAFDMRYVEGGSIQVRGAKDGEQVKLLDGEDYTLKGDMLVIADSKKTLAVAGVMGGEFSAVSTDTTEVLLEAARFSRGNIRATARALGIRTDSSTRFERGVDYLSVDVGRQRALALFSEYGIGELTNLVSNVSALKPKQNVINTSQKQINALLGIEVPQKSIIEILSKLEIDVSVKKPNEEKITAKIPLFREDIEGYPDLAEEVIRFYGYDKVKPSNFNSGEISVGGYDLRTSHLHEINRMLVGFGCLEAITYSFVSEKQFDLLNVEKGSELREAIKILNPLSSDYTIMRNQLIGSLLHVTKLNISRKNKDFRLFEVARGYYARHNVQESEVFALSFYGTNENFYTLKEVVAAVLCLFRLEYSLSYTTCSWLHAGMGADINLNGETIGSFGKIHPLVAKNFDLPENVFVAQISLNELIGGSMSHITYKKATKYPPVERDLALVVKDDVLVGDLIACIKNTAGELCEDVKLFDVYRGEQIEKGFKSVALSIVLRSNTGTLQEVQIQEVMGKIITALKNECGARLRE